MLVKRQSDWFPVFSLLNGWGYSMWELLRPSANIWPTCMENTSGINGACSALQMEGSCAGELSHSRYAALEWWKLSSDKLGW